MAFFFVACSDDDSDFAVRPSDGSSSSVCEDCDDGSSSSAKSSSSSEYERVQCNVKTDENCIKDDRDGQTYKTVKIGDQWWMAENLNYETPASYCYGDNASKCTKYGRLYAWGDAMDSAGTWSANGKGCGRFGKDCSPIYPVRGICPNGWHLPDSTEWQILFNAVGGKSTAGTVLKSTNGWNDYEGKNGNGNDAFGFSALPVGYMDVDGGYGNEGYSTFFWSSTEYDSDFAYYMELDYYGGDTGLYRNCNNFGFSVRCLKD